MKQKFEPIKGEFIRMTRTDDGNGGFNYSLEYYASCYKSIEITPHSARTIHYFPTFEKYQEAVQGGYPSLYSQHLYRSRTTSYPYGYQVEMTIMPAELYFNMDVLNHTKLLYLSAHMMELYGMELVEDPQELIFCKENIDIDDDTIDILYHIATKYRREEQGLHDTTHATINFYNNKRMERNMDIEKYYASNGLGSYFGSIGFDKPL